MPVSEKFIKLKVHPDSKRESLVKKASDSYEIWIKAPAERGLANTAALRLLAQALGLEIHHLRIVRGGHKPNKIVKIITPSPGPF